MSNVCTQKTTTVELESLTYETLAEALEAFAELPPDDLDRRIFFFTEWYDVNIFVRASDVDRAQLAAAWCMQRTDNVYSIRPEVDATDAAFFDYLVRTLQHAGRDKRNDVADAVFAFWRAFLANPVSEWTPAEKYSMTADMYENPSPHAELVRVFLKSYLKLVSGRAERRAIRGTLKEIIALTDADNAVKQPSKTKAAKKAKSKRQRVAV